MNINNPFREILDRIISPATRNFLHFARLQPGYSLYDFLHGYIYSRWPYLYIGIGTGEHPIARLYARLFANGKNPASQISEKPQQSPPHSATIPSQTVADRYHGKVVTLASARQLVTIMEPIEIRNLEQVIPYTHARDIVMQNPDHLVALECPCRSSRHNPCLPLDVCLIVGEPFASFVMTHHPNRARWITSDEAVQILQEEQGRGHVHHAFFKDAMLGRFYAICNCCACCCGAMQAHQNGTPMLAASGYHCLVDTVLCLGCGDCVEYCQFGALHVNLDHSEVDTQACMGCGVCVDHCQQYALSLVRSEKHGEPLELFRIIDSAKLS